MKKALPVLIGLAVGLLCLLMSVLVAGAGHGWTSALPFGIASLVLFPIATFNLWNHDRASREGSLVLLAIACGLDFALFYATMREGVEHFHRVLPFSWAWLALWGAWQVEVAITAATAPGLAEQHRRQSERRKI